MATINGTPQADTLMGTTGNDSIYGGAGGDFIVGDDGNDSLYGGDGDDFIRGGNGTDIVYGGDGADQISSSETMYGGAGNDFYLLTGSANLPVENPGEGIDSIYVIAPSFSLGGTANIENILFGWGPTNGFVNSHPQYYASSFSLYDTTSPHTGTGNAAGNLIVGSGGADTFFGLDGDDSLYGDAGADSLVGGLGQDTLDGFAGDDRLFGGDGSDTLFGGSGADSLDGGNGSDLTSYSGTRADYAVAFAAGALTIQDLRSNSPDGTDTLTSVETISFAGGLSIFVGGPGADTLSGTSATDTIYGQGGDDLIYGGASPSAMDAANTLYGGDGDDVLVGGYASDLLDGGVGNDTLIGSGFQYVNVDASDTFYGGAGDDTVWLSRQYVSGAARLDLSNPAAVSTLTENGVVHATFSGVENLRLTLGSGDDSVIGGVGMATLYGGDGNDTLTGGVLGGYLSGGAGDDVLDGRGTSSVFYSDAAAVHIDLNVVGPQNTIGAGTDTLINVAGVGGSFHADTLIGTARADSISGNSGSDLIYGAGGNDSLEADPRQGEHATVYGGDGDDAITVGGTGATRGAADVYGGDGADTLTLGEDGPTILFDGGAGADRVDGQLWPTGHVTLTLGSGSDTVSLTHDTSDPSFNPSYEADIATVTDFQAGAGGDVLDLAPLIAILGSAARLHLLQVGPDTLVQFDPDGDGGNFLTAFTLSGVRATAMTGFNLGGQSVPVVPDTIAPALTRLDLPQSVPFDAVGVANVVVGATDGQSGVSSVSLVFDRDWIGASGSTHIITLTAAGGGFASDIANATAVIEPGSPFGAYTLVEADVTDVSGNVARYDTAHLAALGFDTGFDLVDTRPPPPPPPPPPDVSVSGPAAVSEGDSFHLTLSFTGTDTLPGTAFVSYNPSAPGSASPDDIDFATDSASYQVVRGADGTYTFDLPSHHANADSLHEAPETLVLTVQVPGHVFANGSDATTISLTIQNVDRTTMISPQGASVTGSAGDDRIFGNVGNDTLVASAGADGLYGGGGSDVLSFAGFVHDYGLAVTAGAGVVSGGPEGGTDTLSSIEYLQFLDGKLTFDTGSTAAQILRLYDSFLGRAPDVGGFDSYLKFFAAGHTFQDMAANAAASPEFHDATAALTDTQYITYVYEHSLRREPDPGGLQNYLNALHDGSLTRTSMIVQAAESPEHVALTAGAVGAGLWVPDEKVEGLELLYDAAVQRQPDPTGIAGYTALLASGTTFKQIANQMAASAEFHAAHDGQTDAQYVDSLYVAEVGRHADAPGLAAYLNELAHGHTRGDLLYETAMSQEHQSHVLAFYDPLLVGA